MRTSLVESGAQVYAMGVFDADYSVKPRAEERNAPRLLDEVALETGGHDFPVRSLDELPVIGVQIARELRSQDILGYAPTNSLADGKYRRVNLKLVLPNYGSELRTYYRHGYYAPDQ